VKFLNRTPQNCAQLFSWFEGLFLFGFISVPISIFIFHWFAVINLATSILLDCVSGFLAYQIGYRPIIAIIWIAALFVPYVNLIVLVVLFIQVRTYLKKSSYKIGLWGARPISPEAAEGML
jgi:uncharacterized paraquat-inducible protein A